MHICPFSKSKFNLYEAKSLTVSTLLHRLVLTIELGTVQTGTGKVDPARKFQMYFNGCLCSTISFLTLCKFFILKENIGKIKAKFRQSIGKKRPFMFSFSFIVSRRIKILQSLIKETFTKNVYKSLYYLCGAFY